MSNSIVDVKISEKARERDKYIAKIVIKACYEIFDDHDKRTQCIVDMLNAVVAEVFWKALEDDNLFNNFVLKIVDEIKKKVSRNVSNSS